VISVKQQQISVGSNGQQAARIQWEGKLNIRNPQSSSLLQPAITFSVEIHFLALLVVLSVVSLDPLEVRGWAEMLGRKERRRMRRVRVRMMRWLW
jgi:hypothetical protein